MALMNKQFLLPPRGTKSKSSRLLEDKLDKFEISMPNWPKHPIEEGLDLKRKGSLFIKEALSGSDKFGN